MKVDRLNFSNQPTSILLITLETNNTDEQLVEIVANRYHFCDWLAEQSYDAIEINDSLVDFMQYNKHTFHNGDVIRIRDYKMYESKGI